MNFKEGEVLYFDKPLRWTSFALVNKVRYHISRKLGVKRLRWDMREPLTLWQPE